RRGIISHAIMTSPLRHRLTAALLFLFTSALHAEDIVGVHPAALDQPRIYMNIRRESDGKPLTVTVDKETSGAIEAFLDTGAGGILLSASTAKSLKIAGAKATDGSDVTFDDIGVAGAEKFLVSPPLYVSFAPYSSNTDGEN